MKPPCKNCERRFVGCHSKCSAFGEYLEQHEKEKATEMLNRKLESLSWSYIHFLEQKKRRERK